VVVTTPQGVAVQDVRRCVVFCEHLKLPVLGVVENMSGFACPKCGEVVHIFGSGGGEAMAEEMGVPFLSAIPIEADVVGSGESGDPIVHSHPHSQTAMAFGRIVRKLLEKELSQENPSAESVVSKEGEIMMVAIPVTGGQLSSHFGHCEKFYLYKVDMAAKTILNESQLTPPPHEPGTYPKWLHEQGANLIIAGGMGSRAQSLFNQNSIEVVVGAPVAPPATILQEFMDGILVTGSNVCDH